MEDIAGPLPTHCPGCGKPDDGTIAIRPQNTAFADPWKNYLTLCEECQEYSDQYWDAAWEEHYNNIR